MCALGCLVWGNCQPAGGGCLNKRGETAVRTDAICKRSRPESITSGMDFQEFRTKAGRCSSRKRSEQRAATLSIANHDRDHDLDRANIPRVYLKLFLFSVLETSVRPLMA
ncbi:hypothetical protein B0T21DRAFT_343454 [Apiosordaria backusii]|uniref:Uncharacterized protein n=1 Tax=Apiosordaria backusii TaxID=314023 RepID=A0AA40K6H8_9PEZI|nr:hypothetical protein B0T21DRAFT_343454 [Apiosordaria backusii]